MAHHDTQQGAHSEHSGIHLPDPSIWPLVVGLAFAFVGAALIWWQRDTSNDVALVAMGAAGAFALIAAAGWAYEDGRMRAKAEQGVDHGPRSPRFNQLVTFALAEGTLEAASGPGGVLAQVEETANNLRDLDGFQDLRITLSPAETGPSQVVVETTWSGREELASYDESRQTILDILATRDDQVVPGSVQAFDMQVVRDTKDTSFRFGWGAATTILGALVLGGFGIGAGLTAFEDDTAAVANGGGNGNSGGQQADAYKITATDNAFDKSTLQAPPNTQVTFTLVNNGKSIHNLSFYQSKGGQVIQEGQRANGGQTVTETFTTPAEGTYYFQCDFHPDQMNGTFEVTASAPPPGGGGGGQQANGGGGGGAPAGGATLTATDNKFDKSTLEATANQPFNLTLKNDGKSIHNVSFYDKAGGALLDPAAEGKQLRSGQTEQISFTPKQAGNFYFQCDFHPTEMKGTFTVK